MGILKLLNEFTMTFIDFSMEVTVRIWLRVSTKAVRSIIKPLP